MAGMRAIYLYQHDRRRREPRPLGQLIGSPGQSVSQIEQQTHGRHHRDARMIYGAPSNLLNEFGKLAIDLHTSNQQQK